MPRLLSRDGVSTYWLIADAAFSGFKSGVATKPTRQTLAASATAGGTTQSLKEDAASDRKGSPNRSVTISGAKDCFPNRAAGAIKRVSGWNFRTASAPLQAALRQTSRSRGASDGM